MSKSFENDRHILQKKIKLTSHICQNMVNSLFTQTYVVSITHCGKVDGGVHIVFQVVHRHPKEYGLTWLQDCVLRTWFISSINFQTSIPHRRSTYFGIVSNNRKLVDEIKYYVQ